MRHTYILCCLIAQLLLGGHAAAFERETPDAIPDLRRPATAAMPGEAFARDGISLDQAAARVRRQTGGRIIKAESRSSNGRTIHLIRVLTRDGRVFTVRVDAASGRTI